MAVAPEPGVSTIDREVLDGVIQGLTNQQIAARIGRSSKNVEYHLKRLFIHYGATNRTELVLRTLPSKQCSESVAESLQQAETAIDQAKQHVQAARSRFTRTIRVTTVSLSVGAAVLLLSGERLFRENNERSIVAHKLPLVRQIMYYRTTGEGGAAVHDQILGIVGPAESPRMWQIDIPRSATRVEATIVHPLADGTNEVSLDVQIAGVLQVNDHDALRWFQRVKNINGLRNGINHAEFIGDWRIADRWIDITPLVHKGASNTVTYMHQDTKPAGVRIRYYDD